MRKHPHHRKYTKKFANKRQITTKFRKTIKVGSKFLPPKPSIMALTRKKRREAQAEPQRYSSVR